MLPEIATPRLRPEIDSPLQPSTPAKEITDALSELVPGQRIMAEIKALMANGTYRALVNQRDVTLALPFSAKAGDTLEMEVVDNNGRLALAVISRPGTAAANTDAAVTASLSRTGNLIADLMGKAGNTTEAKALPLNSNQPLLTGATSEPAKLAGLLRQTLGQSGMFYEAHQAQWIKGQLPTAALRAEPQGLHTPLYAPLTTATATTTGAASPQHLLSGFHPTTASSSSAAPPSSANSVEEHAASNPLRATTATERSAPSPTLPATPEALRLPAQADASATALRLNLPHAGPLIAPDLAPIVQQQLDALATQTFVWQGQAWPGQSMHWEIREEEGNGNQDDTEESARWQTSLNLKLPQLGDIGARLRIQAGAVRIELQAENPAAQSRLSTHVAELRQSLGEAGIRVEQINIVGSDESAP